MSLELVFLAAAVVVAVFGYVLFVRIRMREKGKSIITTIRTTTTVLCFEHTR